MNNIIANIRTQLRKLKCRIANLTKRVAYIEDNCCNGGGGGDIPDVSATERGVVNNEPLQELGGVDKLINGVRIGRGSGNNEDNLIVGKDTLSTNTTGTYNTAFGGWALTENTTGSFNSSFGSGALYSNTTGIYNNAFGTSTLQNNTTGSRNVGVGTSLFWNSTGQENTGVGSNAGYGATTGSQNTYIGNQAGYNNGIGSYNTAIGSRAMITSGTGIPASTLDMNRNVFIGAGLTLADGVNDVLAIDNKGATNTFYSNALLYGNFADRFLRINGRFEIDPATMPTADIDFTKKLVYNPTDGKVTAVDDTSGGGIQSIIPGDNISVDNTDPQNPVISSTGGSDLTLEQARQNGNGFNGWVRFNGSAINTGIWFPAEVHEVGDRRINIKKDGDDNLLISNYPNTNDEKAIIAVNHDGSIGMTVNPDNLTDKEYTINDTGILSSTYTAPSTNNHYVQRQYVLDNFIAKPTEGSAGQVLTTDGAGSYTWEDISGGNNYVSVLDVSSTPTADKVVQYSSSGNVNTGTPTLPENTVNLAHLNTVMSSKVDVVPDMGLSKENFTTEEKSKLAGLESPKFKGQYLSLTDLQNAGNGEIGGYAYVDNGVSIDMYIWDNTNEVWDIVVGESTTETPASIKSKYESNPDTNAFTDVLKNKLEAFTSNFTVELKNTYDTVSNIVTTHQATIGKVWTPDYSNMEATNRITTSGGTWTVPAGYKGWVNLFSRGYNGSSIYNMDVFIINGKPLGKIWVEATSGSGAARSGSLNGFYPVKEGDVIQVYGNLERSCYFIPGMWV